MQYQYNSHVRNLEEEALLEKQKIQAQLYEHNLITKRQKLADSRKSKQSSLKTSRKEVDKETAAYLQRARLQAEFSASRSKAESSMNRSRIEAALELRRENHKVREQQVKAEMKRDLVERVFREQEAAYSNYQISKNVVRERIKQEEALVKMQQQQDIRLRELEKAYRQQLLKRQVYYYPY